MKQSLEVADLPAGCLAIDLEVGTRDGRIYRFAAVRGDTDASYSFHKGDLASALAELDDFSTGATFLLGHNLLTFDLPFLSSAKPDLRLLKLPSLDTLLLNPLAFPRNPYHHLVKHYQDPRLRRGQLNDPELDARLALELFRDQIEAFQTVIEKDPDLVLAWHWLTTVDGARGFEAFFSCVRGKPRPEDAEAHTAIEHFLSGLACKTNVNKVIADRANHGWGLAYSLAWLSVSGGNSVMPPWVRHQFPKAALLVRQLRDTACSDPSCLWCNDEHNARKGLQRWFGFDEFRPEPAGKDGRSLQQAIVEAAMRGEHVLGILPTGTGKSLCYQVPALSRHHKTGALTVVISPLVALMADQVAGLEARGISSCAAVNGLLSLPERADVLDRVRLGDIAILLVSPEQLRNRSLRRVLDQREIGAWVIDEAHCISKWGHDFRPDYRYAATVIKKKAEMDARSIPPVICLTATAKPDVVNDIINYFSARLGVQLKLFDGGAYRPNLDFVVVPTTPIEKLNHIYQVLMNDLPPEQPGGAIVYCATRSQTERVAEFIRAKGLAAEHFHAKVPGETKKSVQERFVRGELRVIAATNAFGMGIDKPDVRLVIHADIPGSLENYMQEAGRAGRDREAARCVLLYSMDDVERQFGMSARSRLTQREIQSILKSLRNLDRRKRAAGEIVATPGEILAEDEDGGFERDSATDDTRVRTAIAWLEEAQLLRREENLVQVFPSSLRVRTLAEARAKLATGPITDEYRRQLLSVVEKLITADADEGISTDELGLASAKVRQALYDLERLGISSNDTALTAFVHAGVERSSRKRLDEAASLEIALIEELRLAAPDMGKGEKSLLHLRHAAQRLKDAGFANALPVKLQRLVRSISNDGRSEDEGRGSIRVRTIDPETMEITLEREWDALARIANLRRRAATRLLDHLLDCLPQGARGTDLLAESTLGKLVAALESDLTLKAEIRNPQKLVDRALLWLHEQEVIRLNKGLAVFRPAMTIFLEQDRRGFVKSDFEPLKEHYEEQVLQIHVMAEYVSRGLKRMADALRLAMDYFSADRTEFMQRWLPDREDEVALQTTPASWQAIVESLNNPVQQKIVTDDREQTNVLVLAGPGAGKTRILVHRIAYLIRVRREKPSGILALAYNRHAAVQIRRRLNDLIGDDSKGVTVMTCHALAMRLAGVSFVERSERVDDDVFAEILRQAIALLKGDGLETEEEADEQRERLLRGFRWILVDEYQDISSEQYELISALAGRMLDDEERKLSLFAVGDDDQNIYEFAGASVEFIRRFEADYAARPAFLTENYRSTPHIIAAANRVIGCARNRMKVGHPIKVDRARAKASAGGEWQTLDAVGKGRVQVLPTGTNPMLQAMAVMSELLRLSRLDTSWSWARTAVIAREWKYLEPVRTFCQLNDIPVQMADQETVPYLWRLRETRTLVRWLNKGDSELVDTATIRSWLDEKGDGRWWALLREAAGEYAVETAGAELLIDHFVEWLAEWGRDVQRRQWALMLLTAHRAKGLEFDHVAVLDGGWDRRGSSNDADSPRRLYYVAMTRARKTLALGRFDRPNPLIDDLQGDSSILFRADARPPAPPPELARRYKRLSLREVDLGFAGRQDETSVVHRSIAGLTTGDTIELGQTTDPWQIIDRKGNIVGRLARAFTPPSGYRCAEARVAAIISRKREDSQSDFNQHVRCAEWEVVVPDLVFEPNGTKGER